MGMFKQLRRKIAKLQEKIIIRRIKKEEFPQIVEFYYPKKVALERHAQEIEILVLGSSHGQAAVDTSMFVQPCFNLSIASQDMYYSFELCRKYLPQLPRLNTVVLFFSVFSSGAEMQKISINKPLCHYYKYIFDIDYKYPWPNEDHKKIVTWLANRLPQPAPTYMGYTPIVGTFNRDTAVNDIKAHVKHAKRGNGQEYYVTQIAELCKQHNIRLIVVIPPHSPNYRKYIEEVCESNDFPYNKLFTPLYRLNAEIPLEIWDCFEHPAFTNEDFWDWKHLAPHGAQKFTTLLKEKLAAWDKLASSPVAPARQVTELSSVCLELSHHCNAKCPFCPRQILTQKPSGFMSKEIFYEAMRQIEQIPSIRSITLAAAGEPLLHPNFDEFVAYLRSKDYFIAFPTNMSLAHKHFEAMAACDQIMYSIEGHDKQSYEELRANLNFEQTLENVKSFRAFLDAKKNRGEKIPHTLINYLLVKDSQPQKFLDLWLPYVDSIRIAPVMPVVRWDAEKGGVEPACNEALKERMLETVPIDGAKKCIYPFICTVIKPDGKMGLCCAYYNLNIDLGDYRNILYNFENNPNLLKIRNEFETDSTKICKNCPQFIKVKKEYLFGIFPELENIEKDNPKITVCEA